jgi:LysR family transcriptional regulator, low CO2-responsive transcriptional regulator
MTPIAQLAAHALVLREKGSKTREIIEKCAARKGVALHPAIEVKGRESVREIVAAYASRLSPVTALSK